MEWRVILSCPYCKAESNIKDPFSKKDYRLYYKLGYCNFISVHECKNCKKTFSFDINGKTKQES